MTSPLLSITGPPADTPSYLALVAVLALLVILTIWRAMATSQGQQFFTQMSAALAFVSSRLVAVVFTSALVATNAPPPVFYMLLNMFCLYLAALCFPAAVEALRTEARKSDNGELCETEPLSVPRSERRRLDIGAVTFAGAGAVVYSIVVAATSFDFTFGSFLSAAAFGATVRIAAFLVHVAGHAIRQVRVTLIAMIVFLTVSWLLVIGASLAAGPTADTLLMFSRGADILALMAGLLSLQSNYLLFGRYQKRLADSTRMEAEKAQKELSLLSKVASDMYEDSSNVIQRQKAHSVDLMKRIDSLEKILRIGITIQQRQDLKELFNEIATLIQEHLGFNTVILRLLNKRTESFETKAHVGLSAEAASSVVNYRLPLTEYRRMIEPKYRISNSYFLKRSDELEESDDGESRMLVEGKWGSIDRLIVPMVDHTAGAETIGYISVEDPQSTAMSMLEAIENMETVATLAVIAIRNARYMKDIGEKNDKLKQYAKKLSELNKMKSNFVATISHEFRTPLTSIKAYCETLMKNADNVDRSILKEFLVVIDEESDRLMTLIEDILDFSQMESGAIKFERAPCDLTDLIKRSIQDLHRNFERKNISLHTEVPDSRVMIRAEHELMKQLLVNLLHNASKFTPEGGNVWVRLEDENVSSRITVADDGVGIPDDQVEKIFDHFAQADNSATREHGGSGLGLAICKNIVDWHDGKIWVESLPAGGTRFVVVLPKKQAVVRSDALNLQGSMRRYEVERYMELLVELLSELLGVKKASIMLLNDGDQELRIESALGVDEEIVEHARVKMGEAIAGRVAQEDQPYCVEDIDADDRLNVKHNDYLYETKSFMSVPIRDNGKVVGVINVTNAANKRVFDRVDLRLLEMYADRVALALGRLKEFTTSAATFEEVRGTLKSILDSKRYVDDQSLDTLRSVTDAVGERLGLGKEDRAALQYIFNVYDVGLTKVGYNLIKQPRPLSAEDRKDIEMHTIVGMEMLEPVEMLPQIRDAVLYHHENYDGSGYPGRLVGEEIPLEARIFRIVDSYRGLTSHRPYQKQYTPEEALEVIRHRSGTYYDPRIASVFIDVVNERIDDLIEAAEKSSSPKAETVANINYGDNRSS